MTATAYFALIKPDKLLRLLASAGIAVLIALPIEKHAWGNVVLALAGGLIAAAAGNALNMVFERDTDSSCPRTSSRPLVTGRLRPCAASAFASVLAGAAALILSLTIGIVVAALILSVAAVYAVIYTRWLKRTTPYYTVAAGLIWASPIVIVWIAAERPLTATPFLVFLLAACWTALHAWAVGLLDPEEYRAPGIPFMPLVWGYQTTRLNMLVTVAALIILSAFVSPRIMIPAGGALLTITATACIVRKTWADGVVSRACVAYIGAFACTVLVSVLYPAAGL